MELKQIILYLCVCTVSCFPSRPLNDRPSELAWQAWLLVDSQNNASESDRRITPKSVFIAPNIGDNVSLPDCAEGYRSDPMGRCIKFVKVDEAAHLDFLLQRLNAMYATRPSDEELDDEAKPTTGPLQLNIPLGSGFPSAEDTPQSEPEIAIIVAPTNGNFESAEDEKQVKFDKRTQDSNTSSVKTAADKQETQMPTDPPTVETTTVTMKEETTTEATTLETTTADGLQALFFLVPINKTDHVQNNRTSDDILKQSDTPIIAPAGDVGKTATEPQATNTETDSESTDNSTPVHGDTQPLADKVKGKPDLETTLTMEDTVDEHSLVRFPSDRDTATVRFPSSFEPPIQGQLQDDFQISTDRNQQQILTQEAHRLTSGEIEDLFKEYMHQNPEVVALTSTDRYISRRRPVSEATYTDADDIIAQPQIQRPQHYYPPAFNHRSRERNSEFWRPAPTWRDETLQKPLVLRFGRHQLSNPSSRYSSERSAENSRYFDDRRQDYSNEFGRKRRRGNLR